MSDSNDDTEIIWIEPGEIINFYFLKVRVISLRSNTEHCYLKIEISNRIEFQDLRVTNALLTPKPLDANFILISTSFGSHHFFLFFSTKDTLHIMLRQTGAPASKPSANLQVYKLPLTPYVNEWNEVLIPHENHKTEIARTHTHARRRPYFPLWQTIKN